MTKRILCFGKHRMRSLIRRRLGKSTRTDRNANREIDRNVDVLVLICADSPGEEVVANLRCQEPVRKVPRYRPLDALVVK